VCPQRASRLRIARAPGSTGAANRGDGADRAAGSARRCTFDACRSRRRNVRAAPTGGWPARRAPRNDDGDRRARRAGAPSGAAVKIGLVLEPARGSNAMASLAAQARAAERNGLQLGWLGSPPDEAGALLAAAAVAAVTTTLRLVARVRAGVHP